MSRSVSRSLFLPLLTAVILPGLLSCKSVPSSETESLQESSSAPILQDSPSELQFEDIPLYDLSSEETQPEDLSFENFSLGEIQDEDLSLVNLESDSYESESRESDNFEGEDIEDENIEIEYEDPVEEESVLLDLQDGDYAQPQFEEEFADELNEGSSVPEIPAQEELLLQEPEESPAPQLAPEQPLAAEELPSPALPLQIPELPSQPTEPSSQTEELPLPAREPPLPPSFLQPAEPQIPPPLSQPPPAPATPELPSRFIPESPEEQIVFSRLVRLTVGQTLELPFKGTGWVYLGELGNRQGLAYDSRRLDYEGRGSGVVLGQSFIFRAERAGTYILKFYKQDFIQDYIINDYVQVIVGERNEISSSPAERVIGEPRWPPTSEPAARTNAPVTESGALQNPPTEALVEGITPAQSSSLEPVIAPETTQPQGDLSPAEYIRQTRQEFDAGRVETAIVILDAFRQRYPAGVDEAWWLYGQLLEANSASRDIRLALEYYRRLVREFPQSPLVDEASRRIAYLERFYFNIR